MNSTFLSDIMELTKFRLNLFVLFTISIGFFISSISFSWLLWFHLLLGSSFVAFSSAIFNQLLEMKEDAKMHRTENRPLPREKISSTSSFIFAWILAGFGFAHLSIQISPATALFSLICLGSYLFFYTPLKKITYLNTFAGAIPGAIPIVIGWVAGGGDWLDKTNIYLFGLMFFWQIPHFFAINWLYREDYEKAGYKMWSNQDESGKKTAEASLFFSILLCLWSNLLFIDKGKFFLLLINLMNFYFLFSAFRFQQEPQKEKCRHLFLLTLLYLPATLLLFFFSV